MPGVGVLRCAGNKDRADDVLAQPVVQQVGRTAIERDWPDQQPRGRGDAGNGEAGQEARPPPQPADQSERERDGDEYNRCQESARQETHADARSEREAARERLARRKRQSVKAECKACEEWHIRNWLVPAHEEPDAAEQRNGCNRGVVAAVKLLRCEGDEPESERHEGAACEPRRIVHRQQPRKELRGERRDEVDERRCVERVFPCELRHDPVAVPRDQVVDDADRFRFVRLPRLMADESGQDPRDAQQQRGGGGGHPDVEMAPHRRGAGRANRPQAGAQCSSPAAPARGCNHPTPAGAGTGLRGSAAESAPGGAWLPPAGGKSAPAGVARRAPRAGRDR